MSGWCVANLFKLTARERVFCMAAASAADVDGISYLFGQAAYWDWHHVAGHNLAFAIVSSTFLTVFSTHRLKSFILYVLLAHAHLLLDYFGSGPNWPIRYLWPFVRGSIKNPHAWEFFSWQNITAAAVLLAWTILIAIREGRTPVELLTPELDRRMVASVRAAVHQSDPDRRPRPEESQG
jgi:hypothetical protein